MTGTGGKVDMKKILVVIPTQQKHRERLERTITDCEFIYVPVTEVTREQVAAADFIVGNVPAQYINQSAKLKLLQLNSAGADKYIVPGALAPDTILTNATGAYGKSVAEHMFAMMMSIQKKLHYYRDDMAQGVWHDYGKITSITDAAVLIIGLGDIGLHFAGMAKALGAYVIGIKRRPSDCPAQVDELHLMDDLPAVLPKADIVLSVLPDTPSTRNIYDRDFFAQMKPTAIFMNAGRGTALDQEALLWALQNSEIMGAALDVTDPEPLPSDHPLWKERNLFITPHISGQYHLDETLDNIVEIAATNLEAYLAGKPLRNIVDFETGYKK